jgi:2-oxo-3-hexenedioate decarboxylase
MASSFKLNNYSKELFMVEQKSLIDLQNTAELLHRARIQKKSIPQLSKDGNILSRAEAYHVQELGIQMRLKDSQKLVGLKMGLTSEGKRRQMNLDSPLYGELTDKMQVPHEGSFSMRELIHPKIEPEVAFLISKTLSGVVSREQVLESCEAVAACMEILDSRYEQFKYFSMEDVIADNSSSSHFVVGPWLRDFKKIDLRDLQMKMSVNGELVQQGNSKEISGDPVQSVVQLCQLLSERNRKLEAGLIVLAGAATAAVEIQPGQKIQLIVDQLLPVEIQIK